MANTSTDVTDTWTGFVRSLKESTAAFRSGTRCLARMLWTRTADREDVGAVVDKEAFDVEQGERTGGKDDDLLAAVVDHLTDMADEVTQLRNHGRQPERHRGSVAIRFEPLSGGLKSSIRLLMISRVLPAAV